MPITPLEKPHCASYPEHRILNTINIFKMVKKSIENQSGSIENIEKIFNKKTQESFQ